ncbi:Calx-beta domain-containing protein [Planctomyces sp. SH-PL62]|uniref:Calx-beta domain-containing protein n=1 Tax=Planctomyces sp. SH-PL62 TaxID=1636152 RepID=UPI0018D47B7D|nr:Calx-beta domain-containing protein [Planctomyces sp. SH-PL62]
MRHSFPPLNRTIARRARAARGRRLSVERLEGRELLTAVSVSDASAMEGNRAMKLIDTFVAPFSGGLQNARGMDYGPDGNLYVSVEGDGTDPTVLGRVNRYDGVTGAFLGVFASDPTMSGAKDVEFGPDGNLYVPNNLGNNVYRFDGTTGASMGVFIPSGSGGLNVPRSLIFGPDGNGDGYKDVYITSGATDSVLRYDGLTGAFLGAFVPPGGGGLNDPTALVFGPDGDLYVGSGAHSDYYNSILRYDGKTGAFKQVFVPAGSGGLTLAPTAGVIFGPDVSGDGALDLYVSNGAVNEVLIYNGVNGSYVEKFIPPGMGGLHDPKALLFDRDSNFLVVSNHEETNPRYSSILRFGPSSQGAFTVRLDAASSSPVTVEYATASGTALADSDFTAASSTLTFAPGVTTRTVFVRTVNDSQAEANETFTLNLSNPFGASIADGQGVGTVRDDDATTFYVVNDASGGDRTYEYGTLGSDVEHYTLNTGNTAPRGAASTAAGTTVWVVDANKKVYVYNTSGGLLGSWTAGTLASNATIEGIATNGTDVWIVDGKQDKVFRYAGAATRTSGSQNAAGSFRLNSGNADPKDLVTDGASIWVVNDSTTDKVFKYSLTGSLLGSWTMTGAGSSPTGITLDPTGGGALWTVDAGTDHVYQFDNARGLTSGSLSPSMSFALAAGNTNPQGIADPPAPGPPRMAASAGISHPPGHPAAHHRWAIPGPPASTSPPSSRPWIAASISTPGPQIPPLIALMPSTGPDFTPPAPERFHAGTKRARIAIRI